MGSADVNAVDRRTNLELERLPVEPGSTPKCSRGLEPKGRACVDAGTVGTLAVRMDGGDSKGDGGDEEGEGEGEGDSEGEGEPEGLKVALQEGWCHVDSAAVTL